jgi:replicative DNA helicase
MQKPPPRSLEAEESLISAILLDNRMLLDVIEILSPDDFSAIAHQQIFAGISELFARSEPIDLITLSNHLNKKPAQKDSQNTDIQWSSFLARIIDTAPVAANARQYAQIVRDKSNLRRLIFTAAQITQDCYDEHEEVAVIMDKAQAALFEVMDEKSRQSFYPIAELLAHNFDTLEKWQEKHLPVTGIASGFPDLDRLTSGFQNSDLIILAARPAMGKTAFALNIARNAAVEENMPIALFSLEMAKEQLSMRMLTSEARVDSARLRSGWLKEDDWGNLTQAGAVLNEARIYIDDSSACTVMDIRAKSRRLKMDQGIGMIIIDYLQLMQGRASAERRDLEISEISRSLKGLAKELDIPIIALSQLNRMLEQRADKRPMLSDLRESGALEQDADLVMFIYRDEIYNKDEGNPERGQAEIILAKHRNGPTGTAKLKFFGQYTRFDNLASPTDIPFNSGPAAT